jgi:hypothetical protein
VSGPADRTVHPPRVPIRQPAIDDMKTVLSNRSREMSLLNEDLARAHQRARLDEAARLRRATLVARARRQQRRAEAASARARRALALAAVS